MTFSVYAKHPLPIKLVELLVLGWLFTILKAPNPTSQPACSKKDLAMLKNSYPASSMTRFSACQSPRQNPHDGKDEFAGGNFTEGSDRRTPPSAATHASIPFVTPIIAPLAASGSANSFVIRYLKDDLQRIVKTIFEGRPLFLPAPASVLAPVVAATPQYEGPRERLLKARFQDIYWSKTHLKCYNFFQQFGDHFAIAGATGPNRVPFAATFLKDTALFRW